MAKSGRKKRSLLVPRKPIERKRESWNGDQWNRNRFERKTFGNGRSSSQWNQNRFKEKPIRTNRDGDIVMTGAKVSSEEARKGNLCFNCGRKGHFARNCREKREPGRPAQRNRKSVTETLKMVREMPGNEISEGEDSEGQERKQVDVSSIFQKLTLDDFDTSDSDEMLATERVNSRTPDRKHISREERNYRAKSQNSAIAIPGEQTDGLVCNPGVQEDSTALGVNRKRGGNSTTVQEFTKRMEGSEETLRSEVRTIFSTTSA